MSPANKVAEVTLLFWVMKICATTLGETAGDLLSMTLDLGYAASSTALLGAFLAVVALQLGSTRFHPPLYWLVIVSTSTAGTTMSDYLSRTAGLGYAQGSLLLIAALGAVLVAWRLSEKTLSVSRVVTRRAELFYWMAVLLSNTLGTALGDFLADDSGLGFLGGAGLIAALIAATALARAFASVDRVLLFWAAFVLTRPLGANLGDLLTKTAAAGGLGIGTAGASAVLAGVLVLCLSLDRLPRKPFSTAHRMFWSRLLGVVLAAYVLVGHRPQGFPPWLLDLGELAGLVLLALAAFGRVWCLIFVGGKKNESLVTAGVYSIVRNPLYVFSFLGVVGFGLAVEDPWLAGILAILFGAYYSFVVKREECFLNAAFGPAYQEYCRRVPRWLPDFRRYREPQAVTVCPRVIGRGILDAMWFIWAFVLWELVEAFQASAIP